MREGIFLIAVCLLFSCSGPGTPKGLKSQIADLEQKIDSLEKQNSRENVAVLNESRQKLAMAYESYADENKDTDSIQSEEYLALAASLYQNTLQQLDKALALNDKIIADYPESERAIFALFNKGYIYNNYIRDTNMAKSIYTDFIAKYPNHKLATDASVELQFLGKSAKEMLEEIQKRNQQQSE
ncbi:MAG: tetratricopeptide repeat protein [Bacteroidota bacterium]